MPHSIRDSTPCTREPQHWLLIVYIYNTIQWWHLYSAPYIAQKRFKIINIKCIQLHTIYTIYSLPTKGLLKQMRLHMPSITDFTEGLYLLADINTHVVASCAKMEKWLENASCSVITGLVKVWNKDDTTVLNSMYIIGFWIHNIYEKRCLIATNPVFYLRDHISWLI